MKRSLAIVFALSSGMVLSASAQSPVSATAPAGQRVAVIAFQAAVAQTNEFKRNYADIEKKYEPKRQQLKAESDEIDTLTKQLQTLGASLSDAERTSRASTIDAKKKQLQRDMEDDQGSFQQDLQDMFKSVAAKVYNEMEAYAQQKGYSLVLDASAQASPVLFAVNSMNITKPVLDAYNQKSGIPAPAVPAAQPRTGAVAHPAHPAARTTGK
jgi:outer membrane protein